MISNQPTTTSMFAAIYNEGFLSPEDDFYCDTLQELRDELKKRDACVMVGDEAISSLYMCRIYINRQWRDLTIENVFCTDDFYTEEQWAMKLGII